MPKKRRSAHTPQTVTHKRRPTRQPNAFPESEPRTDLEGKPIFADDVVAPEATASWGAGSAPIETRPAWINSENRRAADEARRPTGRRLEQLRRSASGEHAGPGTGRIIAGQLPTFERSYLVSELRRIFITSGVLLTLIIILNFVMH